MNQFSYLTNGAAVIGQSEGMETDTISTNGRISRSLMSMKNSLLVIIVSVIVLFSVTACGGGGGKTEESSKTEENSKAEEEFDEQESELSEDKIADIKNIITAFKEKDIDKISNIISYPLEREYPIPSIKDKKEFKQRFSEVFDETIIDKIAKSKIGQWSESGWRGIMLDDGIVWIDGGKIYAVNYQSDFEKEQKTKLMDAEKESLHTSLRSFESPVCKIKTKKYLIRIDKLSNETYRYASWKTGEKESSKPDLILNNGEIEYQGSIGDRFITFTNGNYRYIVGIDGENPTLDVEKDGEIILNEEGTLIEN